MTPTVLALRDDSAIQGVYQVADANQEVEQRLLEEEIVLDKKLKHTIEVVVDRLVMKPDLRQRLTQSVETATSLAEGLVAVDEVDGDDISEREERFTFACSL